MCGIVGYVGPQQAAGRRDRGAAAAGVPRLRLRRASPSSHDGTIASRQAGRQARQPREGARRAPAAARPRPASGTPAGPPTARPTTSTPTRTSARDGRVALVHNGIIENFAAAARRARGAPATSCVSETDTEVAAHLLEARARRAAATSPTAMQRVCRRLEGAFTLVAVDAAGPVPGGRRPPQLAAGRRARRGRELPRLRRRRVHRAHPRGARARPGPGRHDHPRGRRGHRLRRQRRPRARRYHVDWDLSAAEKDGYDWFMRKEIYEQPRAVADALLGRHDAGRRAAARRDADLRGGAARRRQDHHHRLRHRVLRRAWSRSTPSSTGPGSRARSSSPTSSATATRS